MSLKNIKANPLQVKALYDYAPESTFNSQCLSFKTGDVIKVTEKREDGWWKGTLKNNEGLFPPDYCEELTPRRVLNVDTTKASATIKRMQTLLKLTSTTSGEKVEEVVQEVDDKRFTRERAKSLVHSGSIKDLNAKKHVDGKNDVENDAGPMRIVVPETKESAEVELQKRIRELEAENIAMAETFKLRAEKLHAEFTQKVTLLNEMLDEKTLVIEIMKKDLEIKTEENKEISAELGSEIERLALTCADLERQLEQFTPRPSDSTSPHDTTASSSIPNQPNKPTTKNNPEPAPSPSRTMESIEEEATPSSQDALPSPSEIEPSLSPSSELVEQAQELESSSSPAPSSPLIIDRSPRATESVVTFSPEEKFESFVPFPAQPKSQPMRQRGNSFHHQRSASVPPKILRMPSAPRLLYSTSLLDSPDLTPDVRKKIPNLKSSLAKLAELGAHPPSPVLAPSQAEISDLKKRIADLEEERLQIIEEYRTKKENAPPPLPPVPLPPLFSYDIQTRESRDIMSKLDEFHFLFRADYESNFSQPLEKLTEVLDAVKKAMSFYFHFVVLSIKYDAIQSGKQNLNVDASELYSEALTAHLYHGDWPLFVRGKLSPALAPSPSASLRFSSSIRPPAHSSFFSSLRSLFK